MPNKIATHVVTNKHSMANTDAIGNYNITQSGVLMNIIKMKFTIVQ